MSNMNEIDPIAIGTVVILLSMALCIASSFLCEFRRQYYRDIQNSQLEEILL